MSTSQQHIDKKNGSAIEKYQQNNRLSRWAMRPAGLFLQIVRKILKNSTSFVLFLSTKYFLEKRYCHRKILVQDRLYMWPMSPPRLFFMIKSINWPIFVLRVFAKYLQEKSYCYRKIKTNIDFTGEQLDLRAYLLIYFD